MKKEKILTIVGILVLCIALVSGTFAYFSAQAGGTTTRDVSVTSNTTDNLSFSISNDISFTASTANFYQGGNNVSGEATATATLTPNNKTNQATMNYYMYLNLTSNPITYSSTNTNEDPELILQVFDGNNQLITLTGLGNQVTVGALTGYDITGQSGLITLLDNHAITAYHATEVETWHVVITLVNLNLDQNDNGGKTITGEIIMQKEAISTGFTGIVYRYSNNGYSPVQLLGEEYDFDTNDEFEMVVTNDFNSFINRQVYCDDNYLSNGYCTEAQFGEEFFAENNPYYQNGYTLAYIAFPYYIKDTVENNILTKIEACYYSRSLNHEFCFDESIFENGDNYTAVDQYFIDVFDDYYDSEDIDCEYGQCQITEQFGSVPSNTIYINYDSSNGNSSIYVVSGWTAQVCGFEDNANNYPVPTSYCWQQ